MRKIHDIETYRNTLRGLLLSFTDIPGEELDEFLHLFTIEDFPKKSVIIGPDTTRNKLYFVIKGLVRIYYEAEGKEITSDFKEENSFFTNGYTIFTGIPNIDYYVALEDTVCLSAVYDDVESLSKKYHAIEHLGRKMVEAYYAAFLITNFNKLFLSAEERYDVFVRDRASIINRVPLKHVASHLGITPETLSRLRSKLQTVKK